MLDTKVVPTRHSDTLILHIITEESTIFDTFLFLSAFAYNIPKWVIFKDRSFENTILTHLIHPVKNKFNS